MEYRTLGRTGLKVSVLGIGSWHLSGPLLLDGVEDGFPDPGREKVIDLIRAAGDLGINLIDSAEQYGDGEGERRIGAAIRSQRDKWVISTKFGMRRGPNGARVLDASPATICPSLEGSLQRLQTDYIDIYLYHCPPDPNSMDEGREILEQLKRSGKIRSYGISTHTPENMKILLDRNAGDVVMLTRSLLYEPSGMLELARNHGLGVMVRSALGQGLLTGAYFGGQARFANQDIRKRAFANVDFKKYAIFERFLSQGTPMAAFAIRYLLDFDNTHTIVLGGRSIDRYAIALRALELPRLDPQTHQALGRIQRRLNRGFLGSRVLRRGYHKLKRVLSRA